MYVEYITSEHDLFILFCFRMPRFFSLQEAVAMIEDAIDKEEIEEGEDIDLVVIPPVQDELTDEENIDEGNLEETPLPTDVAGTLEVHIPEINKSATSSKNKKQKKTVHWTKPKEVVYSTMPEDKQLAKKEELELQLGQKNPTNLFELFFDNDILGHILEQSNKYAVQNNRHGFQLEMYQLKRFIGFLLFSGYHQLPRERMYWETCEDVSVPIVREALSKHQFSQIKRNLHLADNSEIDKEDKMFKIRQYYNLLNDRFLQFGVIETFLSIDEQMVPYFGRHGAKMFIRGKPVRFGYKLWCLCTSTGYILKVIPYSGKSAFVDSSLGLGASVVKELLQAIPQPQEHAVYFDNFFTSHTLLDQLRISGFHATGTVRENRICGSPLIDSKKLDKQERGTFDWSFDKDAEVLVVKWKDNSNVCLATNFEKVYPTAAVKRFCRTKKEMINVEQPQLINSYNRFMGGVDLHDSFVSKYRIQIKGKKWWWPLFTNLIDSALVNAWRLHRTINPAGDDLLTFRRRVAIELLKTQQPLVSNAHEPQSQRPGPRSSLSKQMQTFTTTNHTIVKSTKRLRCRHCHSQTVFVCSVCKFGIHPKCFETFHKK